MNSPRASLPLAFMLTLIAGRAGAQETSRETPGSVAMRVGFDQHLGRKLPLGLSFKDEAGRAVRLGDYFGRKPVILTLVYYRCPMLCGKELESLTRSLRAMSVDVGGDFEIVTVSISPDETPALAAAKKATYIKSYNRPGAEAGWHFLTGDAGAIQQLASDAGFRYSYNPKTNLYAHAAGLLIATPDGTISKYFSGLDYPAKTLQGVLAESAQGRVGRAIANWVSLLCYDYDESTARYTLAIMRITRVLGSATVVVLAAYLARMFRRDRRRARASSALAAAPPGV